jgi:hypothetical protein
MTIEELIIEVRKCGAVPLLIDGKLKVTPPGKLPADLKDKLRQRADEIKALLVDYTNAAKSPEPIRSHTQNCRRMRINDVVPDSRHPLIPGEVRATIEAIETEAREKGWPAELLWNNSFWDLPRGLAAILDHGDEIGEVNHDYIEIYKRRLDPRPQRFPRRIS